MEITLEFLQTVLDNLDVGVYVLDHEGNYIYVNNKFLQMTGGSRRYFLRNSVYTTRNTYNICVSELVYEYKKRFTLFQDIDIKVTNKKYRQLITSTPIFDKKGSIKYIIAILSPLSDMQEKICTAREADIISKLEFFPNIKGENKEIIAQSQAMVDIQNLTKKIANFSSSVLITGESGVGKEIVANMLHNNSNRNSKEMIEINCASLPENLLESELFGYEKGAFTGALSTGKKGLIEEAQGSTLFLDEVNSLPYNLQGKLLRVLETKRFKPLGASKEKTVDFRLVAATNQDLKELCHQKQFRTDLYYRLNVIPIVVPPLRERKEDIIPLASLFLNRFCKQYEKIVYLSSSAYDQLLDYNWPGNVRELRNLMERLIAISADDSPEIEKIPETMFGDSSRRSYGGKQTLGFMPDKKPPFQLDENFSLKEYLAQCEKEVIQAAIEQYGSVYRAAKILKMDRSSITRKKMKYQIDVMT